MDRDNVKAEWRRGLALERLGQWDNALASYSRVADLMPGHPDVGRTLDALRARQAHAPVLTLRVDLFDVEPVVWRQVRVPATLTFADLHAVLCLAVGWSGTRAHQFFAMAVDATYGPGDASPAYVDEASACIGAVLAAEGDTIIYQYSITNENPWDHDVRVVAVGPVRVPCVFDMFDMFDMFVCVFLCFFFCVYVC